MQPSFDDGPSRAPRPIFIASYPPRECGIATFTRDLVAAVDKLSSVRGRIIALNHPGGNYAYPPAVKWQIERDAAASYREAAELINAGPYDVVNVQHEYGLFGGQRGSHLLELLAALRKPVVLSMHTTLPEPDAELRDVTRRLVHSSSRTIVLARSAIDILVGDYGVDRARIRFVPHGVPNVRLISPDQAKRTLGLSGRLVLATCGLMNPGKGIEFALDAVAGLVGEFPDLIYVIAGETHPGVRAEMGEAYREQLEAQVQRLGLQDHVLFENRYLKYRELVLRLLASDVYVVPYLNLNQIVSGTLAYAVGCGRAVVSTPSAYAREILDGGRGLLAGVRSAESLQARIGALLRNPEYRLGVQARAYNYGHAMIWPKVAQAYMETFQAVADEYAGRTSADVEGAPEDVVLEALTA